MQFVIYLDTLWMEKLEELACRTHLKGNSSLVIWGLKISIAILRHQTTLFGVNFVSLALKIIMLFYTSRALQRCKNHLNWNSYVEVMLLAG